MADGMSVAEWVREGVVEEEWTASEVGIACACHVFLQIPHACDDRGALPCRRRICGPRKPSEENEQVIIAVQVSKTRAGRSRMEGAAMTRATRLRAKRGRTKREPTETRGYSTCTPTRSSTERMHAVGGGYLLYLDRQPTHFFTCKSLLAARPSLMQERALDCRLALACEGWRRVRWPQFLNMLPLRMKTASLELVHHDRSGCSDTRVLCGGLHMPLAWWVGRSRHQTRACACACACTPTSKWILAWVLASALHLGSQF